MDSCVATSILETTFTKCLDVYHSAIFNCSGANMIIIIIIITNIIIEIMLNKCRVFPTANLVKRSPRGPMLSK